MGVPMLYAGSHYKPVPFVPIPPPPLPAPQFSAVEIGAVNASTVAVTFDQDMSASNYATGVTIKINGTATSITSATRQSNHAIVRYVIPVLWHGSGDAVTWEYSAAGGNIVAESGGLALGDVAAQSVANNCEYAALGDWQADALALSDGDPISTLTDQSNAGHDFTQTGTARPTKQTVSGQPVINFAVHANQYMIGSDFADNLAKFSLIALLNNVSMGGTVGVDSFYLSKVDTDAVGTDTGTGWMISPDVLIIKESGDLMWSSGANSLGLHVWSQLKISNTVAPIYRDGLRYDDENPYISGNVESFGVSSPVLLGTDDGASSMFEGYIYGLLLYSGNPSATNRAALEARLAARYGVTL